MSKRLMLAVAVLATALIGAHSAAAGNGHALSVSGTFLVDPASGSTSCNSAGTRCTTTGFISQYQGSLTGTSVADFTDVIDCQRNFIYGWGVETFTGTIIGIGTGTLTWRIYFAASFNCADFSLTNFRGLGLIQSATGQLRAVGGVLQFVDDKYRGGLALRP